MLHASRSRGSAVQNLTRAYAALLTFIFPSTFTVTCSHIPGRLNVAADALSRPIQFPYFQDVLSMRPELAPLPLCPPPSALLSHLLWLVSSPATGEQLENATLQLQRTAHPISVGGALSSVSATWLSNQLLPKKRARSSRRTRRKSRKSKG